jgi:hypothetical protein
MHLRALDPIDQKLYQSVVQKETIAGLDHIRKRFKAHRGSPDAADDVLACQSKGTTGHEVDRIGIDGSQPHFWAWKVSHDSNATTRGLASMTDSTDDLRVLVEITMRKVEPGNIHAGADETLQHFR